MYYKICEKLLMINAPKSLINVVKSIDSITFLPEKVEDLKTASDKLSELVKNKNSDTSKWKEVEEMFKECIQKKPKFKYSTIKNTDVLSALLGKILNSRGLTSRSEEEIKVAAKEMVEHDKDAVSITEFFNKKYIDTNILPALPENKELTFKKKTISCSITIRDYSSVIDAYLSIIVDKKLSGYNIAPEEFLESAKRLLTVNKIVFDDLKEKFFDYYPFTTKGEFKKGMVTIADSGFSCYTNNYDYTSKSGFRLVIQSCDSDSWINGGEDKLIVDIDYSATSDKTPPIFDKDNNPSKPVKVKTVYIKQEELVPGHIYIEKPDGTKLVYLGKTRNNRYAYARLTKKLEKDAKVYGSVNSLMSGYYAGFSEREKPRKFIAEVGTLKFKE